MKRKYKLRTILILCLIVVLTLGLTACSNGEGEGKDTVYINSEDSLYVFLDATGQLRASVNYQAKDKTLTFTSENPEILTIDNKGNYHAVGAGTTKVVIKAYDGTTKTVNVVVGVKAESIGYNDKLADDNPCIQKDENPSSDKYYIFVKTDNNNSIAQTIKLGAYPLPHEAYNSEIEYSIDCKENVKKFVGLDEENQLIIKSPKKGTTETFNFKVNLKVKGLDVKKSLYFVLCPIDDQLLEIDLTDTIQGQDYKNINNENRLLIKYTNVLIKFKLPFHKTFFESVRYDYRLEFNAYLDDEIDSLDCEPLDGIQKGYVKIIMDGKINKGEEKKLTFVVKELNTGLKVTYTFNVKYII